MFHDISAKMAIVNIICTFIVLICLTFIKTTNGLNASEIQHRKFIFYINTFLSDIKKKINISMEEFGVKLLNIIRTESNYVTYMSKPLYNKIMAKNNKFVLYYNHFFTICLDIHTFLHKYKQLSCLL